MRQFIFSPSHDFADDALAQSFAGTSSESTLSPLWRLLAWICMHGFPHNLRARTAAQARAHFGGGPHPWRPSAHCATPSNISSLHRTNKQRSVCVFQMSVSDFQMIVSDASDKLRRAVERGIGQCERPTALTITITEGTIAMATPTLRSLLAERHTDREIVVLCHGLLR